MGAAVHHHFSRFLLQSTSPTNASWLIVRANAKNKRTLFVLKYHQLPIESVVQGGINKWIWMGISTHKNGNGYVYSFQNAHTCFSILRVNMTHNVVGRRIRMKRTTEPDQRFFRVSSRPTHKEDKSETSCITRQLLIRRLFLHQPRTTWKSMEQDKNTKRRKSSEKEKNHPDKKILAHGELDTYTTQSEGAEAHNSILPQQPSSSRQDYSYIFHLHFQWQQPPPPEEFVGTCCKNKDKQHNLLFSPTVRVKM